MNEAPELKFINFQWKGRPVNRLKRKEITVEIVSVVYPTGRAMVASADTATEEITEGNHLQEDAEINPNFYLFQIKYLRIVLSGIFYNLSVMLLHGSDT